MKHIVCFHLFNDYSGSPKVLKTVLNGLLVRGYTVDLVSSRGGVLDELSHPKLKRRFTYRYRFSSNPAITLLRYATIQVYTFFVAFRYMFNKDVVFYINTILPVGAALAGWLTGKKVVYHYHENAFVKGRFYRLLAWGMQKLADEVICVSAYQASFLKRKKHVRVVPNALPSEFIAQLHPDPISAFERKTVLMLSSLKEYKGTREFIKLAADLPQFKFVLVINDTQENIDKYLSTPPQKSGEKYGEFIGGSTGQRWLNPSNLTILSRQEHVAVFYNVATIVINLTDRHQAIETFGLTSLEALSCGLPVIVPTVGGITEFVIEAYDGYRIDVQDLPIIESRIIEILQDRTLYEYLSNNALSVSRRYDLHRMIDSVSAVLTIQTQ